MAKDYVTHEVDLMRRLEAAIVRYMEKMGYKVDQTISDEHSREIGRAVAWLASKYGD